MLDLILLAARLAATIAAGAALVASIVVVVVASDLAPSSVDESLLQPAAPSRRTVARARAIRRRMRGA